MPRTRSASFDSSGSSAADHNQELDSLYDYLAKIILLGPSGAGKSCLLHRFVKNEWRVLSSQTIGVEFSSKIVKIGTGPRRKRIKLQLWDTAGTERFRSVSRSYYRGATGAILVYDVSSQVSFNALPTFLMDARALASPSLTVLLAGNKADLTGVSADEEEDEVGTVLAGSSVPSQETQDDRFSFATGNSAGSLGTTDEFFMSTATATPTLTAGTGTGTGTAGAGAGAGAGMGGRVGGNMSTTSLQTTSTTTTMATRRLPSPSISTADSEHTIMPRHNSSGDGVRRRGTGGGETGGGGASNIASSSTSTSLRHPPTNMTATRAAAGGSGREVSPYDASYWAAASNIPVAVEVSALTGEGVEELFNRLARIILTKIELGEIDPDDPQSGIQYGDSGLYWDGGSSTRSSAGGTMLDDMSVAPGGSGRRRRRGRGNRGSGGAWATNVREWEEVFRVNPRSKRSNCC